MWSYDRPPASPSGAIFIQRQQFKIFVLKRLARRRGAEDVVKRLYVGVVRPALEYASALWTAV